MQIRNYREADRENVRDICKQTAFDSYKKDPKRLETVPIMFCDYFIEQEPENVFILANDSDEAVGYIICAADYEKFNRKMSNEYMQRVKLTRVEPNTPKTQHFTHPRLFFSLKYVSIPALKK